MVAIPFQRTWGVGEEVTAALLNANIRDGYNFVLKDRPLLRISAGTSTSIPNATWTAISFNTEHTDTDGMFAPTSTTVTVQTSGMYMITGGIQFNGNNNGDRGIRFTVNGNGIAGANAFKSPAGSCGQVNTRLVMLAQGATIQLQGIHTAGVALGTRTDNERSFLEMIWFASIVGL